MWPNVPKHPLPVGWMMVKKTAKYHRNPTYDDIDLLVDVYLLETHIIYLWARFNASTSEQRSRHALQWHAISLRFFFVRCFVVFFGSTSSPPSSSSSSVELEQFLKMPRSNIFTPIAILDGVVGWKHTTQHSHRETVNVYRHDVGYLHSPLSRPSSIRLWCCQTEKNMFAAVFRGICLPIGSIRNVNWCNLHRAKIKVSKCS